MIVVRTTNVKIPSASIAIIFRHFVGSSRKSEFFIFRSPLIITFNNPVDFECYISILQLSYGVELKNNSGS